MSVQYTERMDDSIGELLKSRRMELELSLRFVAREAGISPSYLVALEQGRNPTTGRPPMPSPRVLAALGRVLGIGRTTLLELAAPQPASPHVLLYQTGARPGSPADAARLLFADAVDRWLEVPPPGGTGLQAALEESLVSHRDASGASRLGLIFGARPRYRRGGDLAADIEREATWEEDVATICRHTLGVEPVANVCVYREADICRRDDPDPLTSALELVRTHPVVAVQGSATGVVTGPRAVERVLGGVAPPTTDHDTWRELVRVAAIGLADQA